MSAAWEDEADKEVEVDIASVARLRKLRKTNDETTITGDEYQKRLKEFYVNRATYSDFLGWAK